MDPCFRRLLICLLLAPCILWAPGKSFSQSQDLPASSDRSREVINRVRPVLEESLQRKELNFGTPIFIRIFKQSRELELWVKRDSRFHLFKTYEICTYGSGGLGPKTRLGDGMAPEGFYRVGPGQLNPWSTFHLSFDIGYPNELDTACGRTGQHIMVHGSCVSIGCFSMGDSAIEEIYSMADAALRRGQHYFYVHIFPFRMENANLELHRDFQWIVFWENLKKGYDYFEKYSYPPKITVQGRQYMFADSSGVLLEEGR